MRGYIKQYKIPDEYCEYASHFLDYHFKSYYTGFKEDNDQKFEWPRFGACYVDGSEILDNCIPPEITVATEFIANAIIDQKISLTNNYVSVYKSICKEISGFESVLLQILYNFTNGISLEDIHKYCV